MSLKINCAHSLYCAVIVFLRMPIVGKVVRLLMILRRGRVSNVLVTGFALPMDCVCVEGYDMGCEIGKIIFDASGFGMFCHFRAFFLRLQRESFYK